MDRWTEREGSTVVDVYNTLQYAMHQLTHLLHLSIQRFCRPDVSIDMQMTMLFVLNQVMVIVIDSVGSSSNTTI